MRGKASIFQQLGDRIRALFSQLRSRVSNAQRAKLIRKHKDYRKAVRIQREIQALEDQKLTLARDLDKLGWEATPYWLADTEAPVVPSEMRRNPPRAAKSPEEQTLEDEEAQWIKRLTELEIRATLKDPNTANAILEFMAQLDTRDKETKK